MDRDRDRRPDDRYSYRPARSPPRDSYRSTRSPPRRPPPTDTYIPSSGRSSRPRSRSPGTYRPDRRRSRSPINPYIRGASESWRGRPRSPPRRAYSPRRDDRREDFRSDRGRSPRREHPDSTYGGRSTPRSVRERSPLPLKRGREISPARSRGMRSPPPAKRERVDSPPPLRASRYVEAREPGSRGPSPRRRYSPPRDGRGYRGRSRSPERINPYGVDNWRRRSRSPARPAHPSGETSGRDSVATSRRSSPPAVHPSRAALVPDDRDRPSRPPPETYSPRPRSPYRGRSPDRERERERPQERSPPRRRESPPPREHDREYTNGAAPPTGPSRDRNGDFPRAPPTGPSSSRNFPAPVGPSMSAHNRAGNPILSAPSRPRGGHGGRGGYMGDYPRDYSGAPPPHPRRSSGHWPPPVGGRASLSGPSYNGPPTGPRGPAPHHPTSHSATFNAPAPFRGSSNSTSTTYPRTQRFRDHLADVPAIVPGGQKAPELVDTAKILKLEEEAKRLREQIAEKQAKKRQGLREWDQLQREGENATLRAELAEETLRGFEGEGVGEGAAF